MSEHATEAAWLGFLDVDEFIVLADFTSGATFTDILDKRQMTYGVGLHSRRFGPSGHETPPSEVSLRAYTHFLPTDVEKVNDDKFFLNMGRFSPSHVDFVHKQGHTTFIFTTHWET